MNVSVTNTTDSSMDIENVTYTTPEPGWYVYYGIPFRPFMELYGIFIVTVSCIGIIGNILAMVVLSRKEMGTVGTQLLFHLAIPDSVYLITIMILDGVMWLSPSVTPLDHVAIASVSILGPISHTVFTISIYLTVALAVQRYFLVARPLQVKTHMTKMGIRVLVAVIYVCAIVFNIPHWIAHEPEMYWEPYLNRTWIQPKNVDFRKSNFYFYYRAYANLVVKFVIPFIVLLGSTVAILRALYRREFKHTSKGAQAGNRMTIVVLAVVVMSLFCHATTSIQFLLKQYPWKGKGCKDACVIFGRIGNAMVVCNCVFNFLFYCIFGRKFRNALYSIFPRSSTSTSFAMEAT